MTMLPMTILAMLEMKMMMRILLFLPILIRRMFSRTLILILMGGDVSL